jgi:hypothetical protein
MGLRIFRRVSFVTTTAVKRQYAYSGNPENFVQSIGSSYDNKFIGFDCSAPLASRTQQGVL